MSQVICSFFISVEFSIVCKDVTSCRAIEASSLHLKTLALLAIGVPVWPGVVAAVAAVEVALGHVDDVVAEAVPDPHGKLATAGHLLLACIC